MISRLPSLVKPVVVTLPSLYNEAAVEKEMPPALNILEKVDPLIKEEIKEAPSDQVIDKKVR